MQNISCSEKVAAALRLNREVHTTFAERAKYAAIICTAGHAGDEQTLDSILFSFEA